MINSFFSRTLVIGALLIAGSPFAAGQTKVAIVKLQEALLGTSEIKKAQAELQAKYKSRQDEIERLNNAIKERCSTVGQRGRGRRFSSVVAGEFERGVVASGT